MGFLKSRTIWGTLIVLATQAASVAVPGLDVVVTALVSAAGAALSIYGRMHASGPLVK